MILIEIFWSFFQIGLFAIGGGYAALPLIEYQVIEVHNWLTLSEYADLLTISQMTPGPIALNASTFVGIRTAGIPGAIVATIGCITPSCIIVLTLAYFYFKYKNLSGIQGVLKGLRPAVVSLIGSAGLSILLLAAFKSEGVTLMTMNAGDINYISLLLVAIGLFVLRKYGADPIKVMIATGVIGMVVYSIV
ncbi:MULTISPECIES: chromate transporter [unclassified Sedimentibacter]|uniref:chromate transporter n=1 Tax=unclassified Sedimentibacter TaxID=2649220 RepID=UPI0027E129EC|nr:chromate transporter [Sedimentibacter sp. MB35-C1]WMJ76817.1 chromate transporter [Sedimentibacter sp. MB35-C1]